MNRKVKKYLMILLMCSLVYLMAWSALCAHEEKTRQEFITQSENVPVNPKWIAAASVEGLLLGGTVWLYWKSRGASRPLKESLNARSLVAGGGLALAGLAGGWLISVSLAGNLPSVNLPLMGVEQQPVAAALPDTDDLTTDETQDNTSSNQTSDNTAADQNGESEEGYQFPVPELPPVLPESTFVAMVQGVQSVTDSQDISGTFDSTQSDVSDLVVENGGQATLLASVYTKSGDTSNLEATLEAGLNSALFVKKGGSASLLSVNVQTRAAGAPAATVNGTDASLSAADSILTTYSSSSAGLNVLHHASASLNNVHVFTYGESSDALVSAGSSTLSAQNVIASTGGANSAIIHAAAGMDLNNVNGTAQTGMIARLENGASVTMSSAALNCTGTNDLEADGSAISFEENQEVRKSQRSALTLANCQIGFTQMAQPQAWMFVLNNAKADISITLSSLQTMGNHLMKATGSDVSLTLQEQNQSGNISADANSTVKVMLKENSVWNGSLNTENSGAHASIQMDASSTLSLMQDCYLESFEDEDTTYSNISFNGFMIYVNGQPLTAQ